MINLDTSRAARGRDLVALLEAIYHASAVDELDWIEWKRSLDMDTKRGAYAVARTVLGMANRIPAVAERNCEGVGYIVVGVEPGLVEGCRPVDPEKMAPLIDAYTGGSIGPAWDPAWVSFRGQQVLVVIVERPRQGDRMWPLRKSAPDGKAYDGTLFLRKPGATAPMTAADLDAAATRHDVAPAPPPLEVAAITGEPLPWVADGARVVQDWADRRVQGARSQVRSFTSSDSRIRFGSRVTTWEPKLREALERGWKSWVAQVASGVRICVTNPTPRFLPGVQIRFELGATEAEVLTALDDSTLPAAPEPFDAFLPGQLDLARLAVLDHHDLAVYGADVFVSSDRPTQVLLDIGDLRAQEGYTTDAFWIVLHERPAAGELIVAWTATCRGIDGHSSGRLNLAVSEPPAPLTHILDHHARRADS